MEELLSEHGPARVTAYMRFIRDNAAEAVRAMLCAFSLAQGLPEVGSVEALDWMDDGTPIALRVTIDRRARSAVFDFTGTGPQVHGNANAPPAVTYSAVIYCLRCLVGRDIPLNQGCLEPVEFVIPEGSILNPVSSRERCGIPLPLPRVPVPCVCLTPPPPPSFSFRSRLGPRRRRGGRQRPHLPARHGRGAPRLWRSGR